MKVIITQVLSNKQIAQGIYEMVLQYPEVFEQMPLPGQFIHIKVPESAGILRRPISINTVDVANHTITIAYQVKGKGTTAMSGFKVGDSVDVFGFLGHGYSMPHGTKKVLLIGGGIGIAPLLYCAEYWKDDVTFDAILGYRCSDVSYQIEDLEAVCGNVYVACDDGTIGEQGFVSDLLIKNIDYIKPDLIMACGPTPMLKAIVKLTQEYNIPCQISLEERMGCGMGACLVCNCKIITEDGWEYKRVCADGPVFNASEVSFL